MIRILCFLQLLASSWTHPLYNPFEHRYPLAYPNPYSGYSGLNYEYNYVPQSLTYSSYIPTYSDEFINDRANVYSTAPEVDLNLNTLNILAELPYAMSNQFSVVPMYIVSKSSMNMVSQGHIVSISEQQPVITVKLNTSTSIPCTPAVRLVLDKPVVVGHLKSSVLFPSEVQIIHDGVRIPIRIGAVIAPVLSNTHVSQERPIAVRVVYAVPTKPLKITITIQQDDSPEESLTGAQNQPKEPFSPIVEERFPEISNQPNLDQEVPIPVSTISQSPPQGIADSGSEPIVSNPDTSSDNGFGAIANRPDYVNNADAVSIPNQEAVVVESESEFPPKNVTVIVFPEQEAEPQLQVDEEDEELVNRNPPQFLAPAGIVQSTQPESHVEAFHNDKESPYLEALREQANKKRI